MHAIREMLEHLTGIRLQGRRLFGEEAASFFVSRQYASEGLERVAVRAKPMPDSFISEAGNFPTEEFLEYLSPLVGDLPEYLSLRDRP